MKFWNFLALALALTLQSCGAVIPASDFAIIQKYAGMVTNRGSLFVLSESIHSNITSKFILDVRANTDFLAGHISSAINIPYAKVFTDDSLKQLPTDRPIAVVCYTGQSSGIITSLLNALGYEAYDMSFGMASWRKSTEVRVWTSSSTETIIGGNFEVIQ